MESQQMHNIIIEKYLDNDNPNINSNYSSMANNRYIEHNPDDNNMNIINNYQLTSPNADTNKKFNFDNKLQELIDNPKILNTLRSIRSNNSLNYDEIKSLPALFVDIQEALKRSNTNVLELKETINEQITREEKLKNKLKDLNKENEEFKRSLSKYQNNDNDLKNKIEQYKLENFTLNQNLSMMSDMQRQYEDLIKDNKGLKKENESIERRKEKFKDELESREKLIEQLNETIANLKKNCMDLQVKNKKYKSTQGFLKDEISTIEEKLDEIKVFKEKIKDLQSETTNLRNKIRDLEEERKMYINKESHFKEEITNLSVNNRKIKSDLKNELNEKIKILKELESLKYNQKVFHDKHENLKSIIENTTSDTDKINNKLKLAAQEKEDLGKRLENLEEELLAYEDLKIKYSELYSDYNNIIQENTQLREDLVEKKFSDQEVFKMSDKYEEEIFNLKCEVNIWKNAFIEIAKYKLINYDDSNSEDLVNLDKNYIFNSPAELKCKSDGVVTYFKSLIEEENYHTVNLKSLKEALLVEQEKNNFMRERLGNELLLRRKIHNRYMLVRGNLRVMCRIRPFLEKENTSLIKKSYMDTFNISNETVRIKENTRNKNFEFDYIFNQKSHQHEVYDEVSLLVQSMTSGNNICIIAYGQTCTGKTYTIQGPNKSHPGIAIRSAKEIFELIGSELEKEKENYNLSKKNNDGGGSKLSLSIIEIYNENIYNLLGDGNYQLNMYENSNGNLVIPDLNPIKINNFKEASKLFTLASKLRHTSGTNYNDRSSRSHCIYSFHLKICNGDKIIRSKLHIIDLAGSERISKSLIRENEVTKKEAIFINLSLLALANVLNALALKQNHIPYRDSKLTHFLKESLNENFNILLLLHLSPNVRDLGESISTMEFGTRIVKICKHKTGKERMVIGNGVVVRTSSNTEKNI